MNENIINEDHNVIIKNRETLDISGIKKIESLNANEFILETSLGYMTIQGENLEMRNLDTTKGDLTITGYVNLIKYHDKLGSITKKETFLTKLFK